MHGDRAGAGLAVDRQQVGDLERGAGGRAEAQVHPHLVVEAQRSPVLHEGLEHGVVDPFGTQLVVGMAEVAQVLDAGLFQVRQVAAVVHDAHRIGLREAHP